MVMLLKVSTTTTSTTTTTTTYNNNNNNNNNNNKIAGLQNVVNLDLTRRGQLFKTEGCALCRYVSVNEQNVLDHSA